MKCHSITLHWFVCIFSVCFVLNYINGCELIESIIMCFDEMDGAYTAEMLIKRNKKGRCCSH